jgi:long-chain fatty acid transport protein
MNRPEFRRFVIPAALAATLGCWAQSGYAAGFALTEQNASGLGNAYVGAAAVAEDASTIYFNPAGMTRIRGRQVVGALSLISPSMKFADSGASTVPGGSLGLQTPGGGNGGNAGDPAVVPSGYLSWELQPNSVWLGIGVNAPFGLSTEWDSGWVGRFHAIESSIETININPSIAWKVNEQVSLGAGFSAQRMKATLSNAVPYSYAAFAKGYVAGGVAGGMTAVAAIGGAGLEGVAKVDGDSWAWGWNLGATFQVTPATRLGMAYRSTISHDIEGDIRFSNRPPLLANDLPDGPAKANVKLPDSFSLALVHDLSPRWQLLADYTWTGWSSIPALTIEQSNGQSSTVNLAFKNAWRLGAGANYRYDDQWTLRFGVAYDKSPVQDAERTPRLPDNSRVWTGFGAQDRANQQTAFDFGVVYLWIDDASSDLHSQSAGNLVGSYDSSTWIFGAQVRYNF